MANLVITSDANFIFIDYGVFAPITKFSKGQIRKDAIYSVGLANDDGWVEVATAIGNYQFSTNGAFLVVDSINGVVPSDNSNLFDLLANLVK